jgi:hypothetical protein
MSRHRFCIPQDVPAVAGVVPPASGWVLYPLVCLPGWATPWWQVYQLALAQAQAVVRPSRLERLQTVVWN